MPDDQKDISTSNSSSEAEKDDTDLSKRLIDTDTPKEEKDSNRLSAVLGSEDERRDWFEKIFSGADAKYGYDKKNNAIRLKDSGKEICQFEDGKFTLIKPDKDSMQALVDMMMDAGVKHVDVFPKGTSDGDALTELFRKNGIRVGDLPPLDNEHAKPASGRATPAPYQEPSPQLPRGSNFVARGPAQQILEDDIEPTRSFEQIIDEIANKDPSFKQKFLSYRDPRDADAGRHIKMYRTGALTRDISGMEDSKYVPASFSDYIKNRRINNGPAFEVDSKTLAVTALSNERSAIKGMLKFAIDADQHSPKKLKFVVTSAETAKLLAKEAIKQGLTLDQIEINVRGRGKEPDQDNFQLSISGEKNAVRDMRIRNALSLGKGKYADQLGKREQSGLRAGQIMGAGNKVRSRFDASGVYDSPNSRINSMKQEAAIAGTPLKAKDASQALAATPSLTRSLSTQSNKSLGSR